MLIKTAAKQIVGADWPLQRPADISGHTGTTLTYTDITRQKSTLQTAI